MKARRLYRKILFCLAVLLLLVNVMAFMHAWRFTHFVRDGARTSPKPEELSWGQKIKVLLTGLPKRRAETHSYPESRFEKISFRNANGQKIAGWYMEADSSRGTAILFHGFTSEKSRLQDEAAIFRNLGFNTLLVDFSGGGESEGNACTVGYYEAEDVKAAFQWVTENKTGPVLLYGTSMGAAAVMRAVGKLDVRPAAAILECPFASMLGTVRKRFSAMGVPSAGLAELLVFWGGVQHGYWAFSHNPGEYARNMNVPVLLLSGARDPRVGLDEIDAMYASLPGPKEKVIFPWATHEATLSVDRNYWQQRVSAFLGKELNFNSLLMH